MSKWIMYALVGLAGLLIGFALLVGLVNSSDAELRPEVAAILNKEETFTDTQKRAFFYVMGVQAGDDENPEAKGAELWEKRNEPGFWSQFKLRGFKPQFESCDRQACGSAALESNPALADHLKADAVPLRHWIQLLSYGEGATIFLGDSQTPLGTVSALPIASVRLHDLLLLQMAVWLKRGGEERAMDLLAQSNRYFKTFLKQGTPAGMNQEECFPAAAWMQLKYPWQWVSNPAGKAVAALFVNSTFRNRRDRMNAQFDGIDGIIAEIRARL